MDLELRLAALSKLMNVQSDEVDRRLREEFGRIEDVLLQSSDYNDLSNALKTLAVLGPRFHMAVLPLVKDFLRNLESKNFTVNGLPITQPLIRHRSPGALIGLAVDAAWPIRLVHTEQMVELLLEVSAGSDKEGRRKAGQMLESLAKFDLELFYGESGLGAQPQARIVAYLAGLSDHRLVADATTILRVVSTMLSPSIEGHSWTYSGVTIRRGSIISEGGVAEMRASAITFLKRMYNIDRAIEFRMQVLQAMSEATRRERPSDNFETTQMFTSNTVTILVFLRDLIPTEELSVVQKIEHQAFWIYNHAASPDIEQKALAVRDALASHREYQIYKNLIGFEGVFGNWEDLRHSEAAWDFSDKNRYAAARQYLEEINESTYDEWYDRILEFSKTRSNDLATFPVYYEFLESVGREKPRLAMQLVTVHTEFMAPFLIAMIRGLWGSAQSEDIASTVERWIKDGVYLQIIAKSLYRVGASHLDTLCAVMVRAIELNDHDSILEAMGGAANLFAEGGGQAKSIFFQGLRELAAHHNSRWANVVWFSRDFRNLVDAMTVSERTEVLASLSSLPALDHQAEEVLSIIGTHDIQSVLDYLIGRLKRAREQYKRQRGTNIDVGIAEKEQFEAIPYHLGKLNKLLAEVPEELLSALRSDYGEEARGMFIYGGARLVTAAFPTFGEPLEGLLLKFVESGGGENIGFVIDVLHAYEGSDFILGICKRIIKEVPEESRQWNEVASAIESTGVVSGDFGMMNAFEHKRDKIAPWLEDDDSRVRAFAKWLTEHLESRIEHERHRAEEDLALRKFKYGEGNGEN